MPNEQICSNGNNRDTIAIVKETGLRAAKRRTTAHTLSHTAFELTRTHGLDGFTLEELAEHAGVSRRTFANYFSCKEEAVTALAIEQLRDGINSMPELPATTSLIDWVRALAKHQLSGGMLPLLRDLRSLAAQYPALDPHLSKVHTQIRREAQTAVSARAGEGMPQLTVRILVGASYGALMAVIDETSAFTEERNPDSRSRLENADGESEVDLVIDAVFTKLSRGL